MAIALTPRTVGVGGLACWATWEDFGCCEGNHYAGAGGLRIWYSAVKLQLSSNDFLAYLPNDYEDEMALMDPIERVVRCRHLS